MLLPWGAELNGSLSTDEVIRKRLLIDGDGAGDDRRINLLVKSFIKWCNSGSQEEGYSQYQRMLSTLSQCEFSMGKTLLVYDMNLREMENYEKIYKDIENSIAAAHEKISECKKQILQAKRIRKNRQEYDALAKVIQHHPDRHETLKQLEALGKELQNLSHIKENVEDKLELRRKQFHVLLSTIHELQQTLEISSDFPYAKNTSQIPVFLHSTIVPVKPSPQLPTAVFQSTNGTEVIANNSVVSIPGQVPRCTSFCAKEQSNKYGEGLPAKQGQEHHLRVEVRHNGHRAGSVGTLGMGLPAEQTLTAHIPITSLAESSKALPAMWDEGM
ncbi:THO complex subunit 7 like protein [Willisornis vidua]|uniref:THO complex subunit 7 like protein n=1 Tax=Willisornis vidua TaxID=1566151 RepID=A0ABQ9CMN1_9PASS|nr:THO complex subunit 7 like protein [Willisornis vidua]